MAGDMGTELLAGMPDGGYPAQTGGASRKRQVVGVHQRLKEHRKKVRAHLSPEASRRVSEKIDVLVKSGEVPNTAEGRKKAAGEAYGMEASGRLRRHGKYIPKKKG